METLYRLSYWGVLGLPSADRLHGQRDPGEIDPTRYKVDSGERSHQRLATRENVRTPGNIAEGSGCGRCWIRTKG